MIRSAGRMTSRDLAQKASTLGFHAANFMKFILARAPTEPEFHDLARKMIRRCASALGSLGRGGVFKGSGSFVDEFAEFVAELVRLGVEHHPTESLQSVEAAALDSH